MKLLRNLDYFCSLCISLPVWFYLFHFLIAASHPDRLVWFLFYVYLPLAFLLALLGRALEHAFLDERFDAWVAKKGGGR
jgi:hypothetical protein